MAGASSSPGIIYALVARGTCVLAEFTTTSGNFTTVTRRILEKLPAEDSKMSYVYDSHIFHYSVSGGLVFMCMADGDFGRRVPFAFLDDIVRRWQETYGQRGQTALAYGMNEDFSRVLQRQMDYFSRDASADRVFRVANEIDEVRSVMVDNIEKVLQRGEKIELLVDKTENLNVQAFRFKKQSTTLRRVMWFKNVKLIAALACCVALVILFIAMGICGADFGKCKSHDPPSPPEPAPYDPTDSPPPSPAPPFPPAPGPSLLQHRSNASVLPPNASRGSA